MIPPQPNGSAPVANGQPIEALLCEAFEVAGETEATANVVYLKLAGTWHRLVIDAGVVFWKVQEEEPQPWSAAAEGWNYPHRDVGAEYDLNGKALSSIAMSQFNGTTRVELCFGDRKRFIVSNTGDASQYHVA